MPSPLAMDGPPSGLSGFNLSMSIGHSGSKWMDTIYSNPRTSRQPKPLPRKTPRFKFKKAKINEAGVGGPDGMELFFGVVDGEQAGACHKKDDYVYHCHIID
jgi:hypothetical protein